MFGRLTVIAALCACACGTVRAQDTQDAQGHKFYDLPAKIQVGVESGALAFDLAQTCRNLANGGREMWGPSQSCRGMTGYMVGVSGGAELATYGLHRLANRPHLHWLHKVEGAPRIFCIQGNVRGIVFSRRHGAW